MTRRYPLLTWQISYGSTVSWSASVTRSAGGPVPVSGTIAAGTYWGQQGAAVEGSTTPHGDLAASIQAALIAAGHASATVTGTWVASPTTGWPEVTLTIGGVTNALSWSLTISDATARRRLGYLSSPVTSSGMTITTTCNQDGIFTPLVPWAQVTASAGTIATQVRSPFDQSQVTRVNLGTRDLRVAQWLHVPMRYICAAYAQMDAAAAQAGTSVLDTYNTLERLVDVLPDAHSLRLHESATAFEDVDVDWSADPATTTLSEPSGQGGRRHTVSIPLVLV